MTYLSIYHAIIECPQYPKTNSDLARQSCWKTIRISYILFLVRRFRFWQFSNQIVSNKCQEGKLEQKKKLSSNTLYDEFLSHTSDHTHVTYYILGRTFFINENLASSYQADIVDFRRHCWQLNNLYCEILSCVVTDMRRRRYNMMIVSDELLFLRTFYTQSATRWCMEKLLRDVFYIQYA